MYIIGEAGSCHEGERDRAISLIEVAKESYVNAVKFQYWSSPQRMRERRGIDTPDAYEKGSIPTEWMAELAAKAHDLKLAFMCTVYLPEDVPTLVPYVDLFKVASFEARDRQLTKLVTQQNKPFFVSTGMMQDHEVSYVPKRAIQLHCVSAYPCPLAEAQLGAIRRGHGYSDHTKTVVTGGWAAAAGADYLEVHYRLDDTSETCPDYCVSLTPDELRIYSIMARQAAIARGNGLKRVMESERENLRHRVVS